MTDRQTDRLLSVCKRLCPKSSVPAGAFPSRVMNEKVAAPHMSLPKQALSADPRGARGAAAYRTFLETPRLAWVYYTSSLGRSCAGRKKNDRTSSLICKVVHTDA